MRMSKINVSALLFSVICCSGFSALMPMRIYFIVLFLLIAVTYNVHDQRLKIYSSPVLGWYLLLIGFIAASLLYSYQKIETAKYLVVYVAGAAIILLPTQEAFHIRCLHYMEVFCKIIAGSIVVQIFIPNLYRDYLYFLIRGGAASQSRLNTEISSHIYSGIVGEKGEAAFLMVIAIVIVLAKCSSKKKMSRQNLIWLITFFIALLLPAKRMLFAVGALVCVLYVLFWNSGNKKLIAVSGLGVMGCIGYGAMLIVPPLNTLLARFATFSGDGTGNGRTYLWEHAFSMLREKPYLGYGYGSYNAYASNKGVYLTSDRVWTAHAHNIYFQMLGEIGLVGTTIFVMIAVCSILMFFKLYQNRNRIDEQDRALLFIGVNCIMITLVYGLTGNVIYYTNQIMFYFWGISIDVYLYKKYFRQGS